MRRSKSRSFFEGQQHLTLGRQQVTGSLQCGRQFQVQIGDINRIQQKQAR